MKLSELIAEATKALEEFGDITIYISVDSIYSGNVTADLRWPSSISDPPMPEFWIEEKH